MRSDADLFVVAGARSPFVRAGGVFANETPIDLARHVVAHLLQGRDEFRNETELLHFACERVAASATDPARLLALRAGLIEDTPGRTATGPAAGLEALGELLERREDESGSGLFVVAAGGSSSALMRAKSNALTDDWNGRSMAKQAQSLAAELGISRSEQDDHAARSRIRARADGAGRKSVIVPIVTKDEVVAADRAAAIEEDMNWLTRLKPLVGRNGAVTAGNTAIPADGAAALFLARRRALTEATTTGPRVRLRAFLRWAGSPKRSGPAALGALAELLDREGLRSSDLDRIEIHEGFAADVLACHRLAASSEARKKIRFDGESPGELMLERVNPNGGAIALGHAGAASGLRMILAMMRGLERDDGRLGAASMAMGGGQALALLVEREGEDER